MLRNASLCIKKNLTGEPFDRVNDILNILIVSLKQTFYLRTNASQGNINSQ